MRFIQLQVCIIVRLFFPLLCPLITFASACWEELKVLAKKRQQELQTAEKCHCFYQDLTEALILIEVLQPLIYQPIQVSTLAIVELVPLPTGATEEHPRRHCKRFAGSDFTDEETRSSAQ